LADLPVISDRSSLIGAIQTWVDRDDAVFISALPLILSNAEARIRRNQNWFSRVFSVSNGNAPLTVQGNPTQIPSHVKTIRAMWASTSAWKHPLTQLTFDELRRLAMTNRDTAGIPTKYAIVSEMDLWMNDSQPTAGPLLYLWPSPSSFGFWAKASVYTVGTSILDTNGNIQAASVGGTSGSVQPTWNPTQGGTTTDNGITWVNQGAATTQPFAVDFKYVFDPDPLVLASDSNALLRRHPDLYFYAALAESAPYLLHDERLPLWEGRYQMVVKEINSEREAAELGAPNKRANLPVVF